MRVPPTERRGRVHTSTVTVAVFQGVAPIIPDLRAADILERVTKGTGPGGQNRNKRETAIILKHLPTGLEVKSEVERTQEANRRVAMATLKERVHAYYADQAHVAENQSRKAQVGQGERSDKIRTYRCQDGLATDHRSNRKVALTQVLAGKLELLN